MTAEASEAILTALFADGLRGKRIHGVGAGGSGLSATLWLAHERGAIVTGCDVAETGMTRLLTRHGMPIERGHDVAHVAKADLVALSPFLEHRNPNLPELVAARERGVPVLRWQALLGYLMRGSIGVSVAGVHGKGTVTGMLGSLAVRAGLDPTVEVGAALVDWDLNARFGRGRYFINEADEWEYNFLHYHPRVVVLNAVEYDHPEFYRSYEEIRDAFVAFVRGMDMSDRGPDVPPPTLVLNADSDGCLDVLRQLGEGWPGAVRTFGIERDADVTAANIGPAGEGTFTLRVDGRDAGDVRLAMPGLHNVANALAAAAAADVLGVSRGTLAEGLTAFR